VIAVGKRDARRAVGLEAQRTRATLGDDQIGFCRRHQPPKRGKPVVIHTIDRHGDDSIIRTRNADRASAAKFGQAAFNRDMLRPPKRTYNSSLEFFDHRRLAPSQYYFIQNPALGGFFP
jgi:hypothetical protein